MGLVEQAIRSALRAPTTLHTLGQGKPFVLDRIDNDGIVLLPANSGTTRRYGGRAKAISSGLDSRGRGSTPRRRQARYRLSMGGRPKGIGDHTELLVARLLGRNLTPLRGCVVQIVAIAVFVSLAWGLFVSGLILRILEPFVQWYAEQASFGQPTPSTLPR